MEIFLLYKFLNFLQLVYGILKIDMIVNKYLWIIILSKQDLGKWNIMHLTSNVLNGFHHIIALCSLKWNTNKSGLRNRMVWRWCSKVGISLLVRVYCVTPPRRPHRVHCVVHWSWNNTSLSDTLELKPLISKFFV